MHAAPITAAPQTGRAILEAQVARLDHAISVGTDPCNLYLAKRYRSRALAWLKRTDLSLDIEQGIFGANGWQPGVDDVCGSLENEREPWVSLVSGERINGGVLA